jgi:hypothetical protein
MTRDAKVLPVPDTSRTVRFCPPLIVAVTERFGPTCALAAETGFTTPKDAMASDATTPTRIIFFLLNICCTPSKQIFSLDSSALRMRSAQNE